MSSTKQGKTMQWGKQLFSAVLLIVGFLIAGKTVVETEAATVLANPRIEADTSMESGQNVTWDCVWFGSYPQAEVVTSAMCENYTALDESLLTDGDLIVSDSVYRKLETAGGWDSNNDIILDGVKYRRIKEEDSVHSTPGDKEYYDWPEDDSWHYFQYEPIKWRVLSVDDRQALLLADCVLDDQNYNTVNEGVTWKTSTVRSWLNGYGASANSQGENYSQKSFLNIAFTTMEQLAIFSTSIVNENSIQYGTEGGENTSDKLFFLSEKETYGTEYAAVYGFAGEPETFDEARRRKSTIYARARGVCTGSSQNGRSAGNSLWWLRSPGHYTNYAVNIMYYGGTDQNGHFVDINAVGVCPALYLDVSSPHLYTYAGTVSSDGTVRKNIALCEASITDAVYTGKPQTPQVTVNEGDTTLEKDVDYTVTYRDNTEAGTAKVEIIGKGGYTGTFVREFQIKKAEQTLKISLSSASIQVGEIAQITADGMGIIRYVSDNTAVATVSDNGRVMGISPGLAKITVTAAGDANYNPDSMVLDITVTEKTGGASDIGDGVGDGAGGSIGNGETSGTGGNTGIVGKPGIGENSGSFSGTGSSQGTNAPSQTINQARTQKITASSKTVVYKSKPISLKAKASGGGKLTYKSSNKKVAVVSVKGKVTVKGYGAAKITIKAAAKGKYKEATKKITVKVVPRAPEFANAKKMKIKTDKTVSGYEIYFSTRKNFKKNVLKCTLEKNAHGIRMPGLKRNVNYYAKARAYKEVGKKTYYSAWSKVIRLKR